MSEIILNRMVAWVLCLRNRCQVPPDPRCHGRIVVEMSDNQLPWSVLDLSNLVDSPVSLCSNETFDMAIMRFQ